MYNDMLYPTYGSITCACMYVASSLYNAGIKDEILKMYIIIGIYVDPEKVEEKYG